jgi:hypothetical protein
MKGGNFAVNLNGWDHYHTYGYKGCKKNDGMGGWKDENIDDGMSTSMNTSTSSVADVDTDPDTDPDLDKETNIRIGKKSKKGNSIYATCNDDYELEQEQA